MEKTRPSTIREQVLPGLRIREFTLGDKSDLEVFLRDPDQLKYMLFDLVNPEDLDRFLTLALGAQGQPTRTEWHLAVIPEGQNRVAGSVALMMDESGHTAELGYWFCREFWGRGLASQVGAWALEFGFKDLGLHRIWGMCHVENPGSARVMEKIGLAYEGTLREHVWLRDHWRSSRVYGLLDRDYFSLKV